MKKIYITPTATIYPIKRSSVIATSPRLNSTTLIGDDFGDNGGYSID